MNLSKREQRVLHVLAQGGAIRHERGDTAKITGVTCVTRDGAILSECGIALFQRLRRRGLIASHKGAAYRISMKGRRAVRAELDNR
ncbi:hypothetical protein ROJ8625_02455 [Roseivivax jejudonensis]|uniref:UPF0386 protein ROJ8625_02455 n=1 Tax=Roseivivax jejudonensis TaxID=1529041 RepID=A0A1X6ZEX6_9RHOB|nr:YjhX family toxin [Roseivivax jejudonensis]SLN49808.1 hypothetical protein ROJ8625_02455 [Roseivivax jejudonensis]